MKDISREGIKRMIDGGTGGSGGGGGIDMTALAGLASQSWVEGSYISKAFFNELFTIKTKIQTTVKTSGGEVISDTTIDGNDLAPNTLPSTTETTDETTGNVTTVRTYIASIQAKHGLWTNFFMSALGLNSSGGGGGALNEPLSSINLSGLAAPGASENGKTVVWDNATGKWKYGEAGGGGGISGSLAWSYESVTQATGDSWNGSTSKTIKIPNKTSHLTNDSGFITSSALINYYTKTEADAKFMTIEAFERLFNAIGSDGSTKINHPYSSGVSSIKAMVGLWTNQYLSALGLNSSGGGGGAISLGELVDVTLSSPTNGQVLTYDGSKWVNAAVGGGTVTSIAMSVPTGFNVSPTSISSSGTFNITFASGYSLPTNASQSNWDAAYNLRHSHENKSVLDGISAAKVANWDRVAGASWWGQSLPVNGVITGSLSSVTDITMSGELYMEGGKHIYFKSGGSYLNAFEFDGTQIAVGYGFRTSNNTQIYGTNVIFFANGTEKARVTPTGLQIGEAVLVYESANNALKLVKSDGTAINFYATGGVSALGLTNGSSGSIPTLTVTDTLNLGNAIHSPNEGFDFTYNQLTGTNPETHKSTADPFIRVFKSNEDQNPGGTANYYPTIDFCYMVMRGINSGGTNWWINSNGNASFKRVYLDDTRYLYVSSGNLYYYNGSTSKQVAFSN